jgi:TonB-dependent starch-binding outer membrane protein SusC
MKNRIIKNILIFCAVLGGFVSTPVLAQDDLPSTTTVTGRIINQEEQPVQNVFVKSFVTNDKALTDAEGNFSVSVSAATKDQLIIDEPGYDIIIEEVIGGAILNKSLTLVRDELFDNNSVSLPYQNFSSDRNVSSINMITGEELESYPSSSFMEALSGRIPGLTISTQTNKPGNESFSAYIRGEQASVYIDGIQRDPSDLSVYEVEVVQVIKDMSGRAALGISGINPIIWITTKKGTSFNNEIQVSAEYGFSTPTTLPSFLNAFQYASLYNEALTNDGLDPLYSQSDLEAYKNGTDPLYFPDVDYYGDFVRNTTPFRRANINFSGGDERVNYFSLLDYVGSEGLEAVGEQTNSDRFKLRGGANIKLNDFIQMNVNLSGTYGKLRYPNQSGGAGDFDIFNFIAVNPANAHAISYKDSLLLISDDYPQNLENELLYSGYASAVNLNTQNNASLLIDLNSVVEGLTFKGTAAFDIYSNLTNNKGGTAALYRLRPNTEFQRMQEEIIEPSLGLGFSDFLRRTVGSLQLDYDRTFGKNALTMNAMFYQGLTEWRTLSATYQPDKKQDFSYRVNYAYDNRYTLQLDVAYTGSMKLPEGSQFNLYPSLGAAWIASNESFLSTSSAIDYLKFYSSFGIMGNDNFSFQNYNTYYLYRTLWQGVGGWQSGIQGNKGDVANIYAIQQQGSMLYDLPKRSYFNLGVQSQFLAKALSVEANYFYQKDYDQISQMSSYTPSLFGTGGFLPVTNFGESMNWGFDGLVQYTGNAGDFYYSIGGNLLYMRGKYLVVDEPVALDDYRKREGKDSDLFWLYESEGLYLSDDEITSRDVAQSWGAVQPGDIRYADYNEDGVVDEKDIHNTGDHSPRLYFGVNLSMKYKAIGLQLTGQGRADGQILLNGNRYFIANNAGQNYSKVMLDRYPFTNDFPRMTTQSQNNAQSSTFWLANAAYFSLKNVELSYTLPGNALQNMPMRNVKVFVRGKNLLTVSELTKYDIEPENIGAGIYTYPLYRTFTFGVSCKF